MEYSEESYDKLLQDLFVRFPSFQNAGRSAYKPGLEHMVMSDGILGHPHRRYRTIHIAGTNGKGSVSNMLASVLSASGLKTGLYTSPHLIDFRERMRISDGNGLEYIKKEEVFDFIVSECNSVAEMLPVDYADLENDAAATAPESGRVTRGMALALKARTLLYRASKLFNEQEDASLYHEAAVANLDVINYCNENGIVLGNYSDLWGVNNWNASEMIFVRRYGNTDSPERTNYPIGLENATSGNCPTQTLVDAYEMQDGSEVNPNNPYEGRDPRFAMTIAYNGDEWPNSNTTPLETYVGGRNGSPTPYATPTGYYLKKYLDGTIDISASSSSGGTRHSWITFRLGEFLLNYAEATFKYLVSADATSDELPISAREAVNRIRQRSDVNMPEFPEGMSNTEFWERYKKERMVELAFEGHRFWDVRRWKEGGFDHLDRMVITKNDNGTYTYTVQRKDLVWDDCMYFYPIPDSEIRKNPNLTQNPGWNEFNH